MKKPQIARQHEESTYSKTTQRNHLFQNDVKKPMNSKTA
jgi:hypothetical protein